ncbi:MAG: chorismate-binding protein [Thermoplasmatota archaeon]
MAASSFLQLSSCLPFMDPLEAYRRLRNAGHRAYLLEGAGLHPEARWSFLGVTPVARASFEGSWHVEGLALAGPTTLAQLWEATRVPGIVEDAPFTGGWVGWIGYGYAHQFEGAIPAHRDGLPDALLHLCADAIAFDRAARRATLYVADRQGDRPVVEARMGALQEALAHPAPARSPEPGPDLEWTPSLSEEAFQAAVRRLKKHIHHGDLFQANLATRFTAPGHRDPVALYSFLRDANPAPYMALLEDPVASVVSGSPELLVSVSGGRVASRPIAGTRKRGATPLEDEAMAAEIRADAKEQAEHTMLVDLVRNDVARVARPGSVCVTERMSVERYRHVMHLASRVEAKLRPGCGPAEVLAALFPGGTITGAPKVRATERIHEAEPVARGPYTGSAGYVSWGHNSAWSILIRGLVVEPGRITVHAGSGIVADSDPAREWREANRKARGLLEAAAGLATAPGTRLGEVAVGARWETAKPRPVFGARVLIVDNYDSFVHNLADYCAHLGAATKVLRNDEPWEPAVAAFAPTHVILGPGPGWPAEAGHSLELVTALASRMPLLGVCLGHQAMAQAFGGRVRVHPKGPVHGRADAIHHFSEGLFAGLESPLMATRYHSLIVEDVEKEWHVDARLADGTVMAIRHRRHPAVGLQFHPESLCTPAGLELVARFLEMTR